MLSRRPQKLFEEGCGNVFFRFRLVEGWLGV